MAKCGGNAVGPLVFDRAATGGGAGFRLWPLFSAAALRRRLIDALLCGVSRQRKKRSGSFRSPVPLKEKLPPQLDRKRRNGNSGSERLADLLKADVFESGSEEAETRRKIEVLEELRGVVKGLQSYDDEEDKEGARAMREDRRREATKDVRRLAKDDSEAREMLAMLGAIPPLVGMLDSNDLEVQIASLYALLNVGIGNDVNKAATVKAGAVHKMLMLIESGSSPSVLEVIVANFLGLSALDSNKPIIGSSGAIPFLVKTFQDSSLNPSSSQAKQDSLRALFNLSLSPSNIPHLMESDLVPTILAAVGDMEVSERVLSVLSNVISSPEGRRAISRTPDAFPILVDVLSWSDSPGCQEKATYVLMVMAHKAYRDRTAMIEAGVVSSLLELTLLGSALAQKRASRVLECLRVDKGKQISEGFEGGGCSVAPALSAPQYGGPSDGKGEEAEEESTMSDERKAVKQLVQQSLQNNMRRIVKRANLPQDFAPSDHFKTLTATSTSKSLPF